MNTAALRRVHPVSDEAFFEAPLSREETNRIRNDCKAQKKKGEVAQRAIRLGVKYSDSAHVRYLLAHGSGGYLVFWFAFENNDSRSLHDDASEPGLSQKQSEL